MDLELRAIQPGDKVSGFSMGDSEFTPLKTFIQKQAQSYENNSLSRTYAIFEPNGVRIKAYITIACGEIELGKDLNLEHPEPPVNYRYSHYPAMKIVRLAVPTEMRGNNIGKQLVEFGLGIAKDIICPNVGCRFVVVDAKKQSVDFYKKCGFTLLDTVENKRRDHPVMFLDLGKIDTTASLT